MAIIKVKDNNPVAAIQELLRSMLSEGLISAILVPQEIPSKKTVVQTLVRDPEKLSAVNPLAPVFSINSAQIITKMCVGQVGTAAEPAAAAESEQAQEQQAKTADTKNETSQQTEEQAAEEQDNTEEQPVAQDAAEPQADADAQSTAEEKPVASEQQTGPAPIAAVLRPCEIRALVELVKLQQISLERFVVIGVDCWGTYSVNDYAAKSSEGSQDSITTEFLKQVTTGKLPEGLRGACTGCQYPAPTYGDLTIQLIGEDINQQIGVVAQTEKGKKLLDGLGLEDGQESSKREDALSKLKENKKQLAGQDKVDFVEIIASLCINCHNCRAVCPICYCKQCVFDGGVFEYAIERYLNLSDKKGFMGMPPDKMLFHLTRMSHVATSCVGCGQCEAACPNGIPLGRIYQKISVASQEALGYEAGRSLDEELPLTTFKEEELSVVED